MSPGSRLIELIRQCTEVVLVLVLGILLMMSPCYDLDDNDDDDLNDDGR